MASFLSDKNFEINRPKALRVATQFSNGEKLLSFVTFSRIFSRCIFKGALESLAERIARAEYSDEYVPPGLQLNAYRRRLIMSGNGYQSLDFSTKEGEAVLNAVKNYKIEQNQLQQPVDEAAYRRYLSKLLLGIENDELFDRIQ